MRIAIIDTGINEEAIGIDVVKHNFIIQLQRDSSIVKASSAIDTIGHGTAIAGIITRHCPNVEILNLKIFEDSFTCNPEYMLKALEYIDCYFEDLKPDIINISIGVSYIDANIYQRLKDICACLLEKDCIVVSAFDNEGALSYPAALGEVVGVDVNLCENAMSPQSLIKVNYCYKDQFYRVRIKEDIRTLVRGTSFACARCTAYFAEELMSGRIDKKALISGLKQNSISQEERTGNEKIENAIVMHYCKESDALIRNEHLLDFNILGIYDEAKTGHIGKNVCGHIIQNYKDIDWTQDFDTVILSCIDELQRVTKNAYKEYILAKCKENDKRIYAFEAMEECEKVFFPKIDKRNLPEEAFGKLRRLSIPIVGIFGTSSGQGKYTLQLQIADYIKRREYDVGLLATEPSGYLFGADFVFPMGYNSTVYLNNNLYEYVRVINEALWESQRQGREIVIAACQSGTVQYDNGNLRQLAIQQYGFILGIQADAKILVVNSFDEMDYIKRTFSFLEGVTEGRVLAIVICTFRKKNTQSGLVYGTEKVSDHELELLKEKIGSQIDVPVFFIDDAEAVANTIIKHFEEAI